MEEEQAAEEQHQRMIDMLEKRLAGYGAEMIIDFKVDGMTCVACSRTLENAMTTEF